MPTRTDSSVDILLVDDREDGLIALEALLGEVADYRLVKASSGAQAIAALDDHDFAVILLDVQMPFMDGFQTAELIRRRPKHRSIPIVFVTAIDKDERYVARGYEAGAVDYLFKPFDPTVLKSKVAVFAELHRKNRQLRLQSKQLSDREILEQKARAQSLELEALRRYSNLAEAIPHIVMRATASGELEYANEMYSRYTGVAREELLGTGWMSVIYPPDLPALLSRWSESIRMRTRFEAEFRIRRYDGVYRWHWNKSDPEMNAAGEVIAWLGTATDIEDRKSFENKLKETQANAEAANDAKTQFLANMSHEIRTPLNAIMGFTELMLDPNVTPEEKLKGVSIVRRNGHQLLKIVDEILDISKVEAGELVTESVEVPLLELLTEVQNLLHGQASKKGIALIFENASAIPRQVLSDGTRLRQVILNIVGNALKFTKDGQVAVATRFARTPDQRAMLHFTVTDTGVGIEGGSLQKIFEPFSQADTSTTRLFGGTGLGLALSRKLARALGGDVQLIDSQIGFGSTFLISIEVGLPGAVEWVEPSPLLSAFESVRLPEMPNSDRLIGKRILLVEDAEDNQFLIQQFLSRTGVILELANNGREGVSQALASEFDAVLMDIQMPFVDGYEATTQLREAGFKKPIIALTAHALIEEREKCLRTGCTGHLTKPIDRRALIESLLGIL